MRLIMCVSDENGIAFNHRRQSRDEMVCKDMLQLSKGHLLLSEYSASLFLEDCSHITVCSDCKEVGDSYYFAEREVPDIPRLQLTQVILYHWNRSYPADRYFTLDLSGFERVDVTEFAGKSHETIRRELWKNKNL
jgi:hypothetical protein